MARPANPNIDVTRLTPKQLQDLVTSAQAELDKGKSERLNRLRARCEAICAEEGFTLRQVAFAGSMGLKAEPKFRDPVTGKTWAGRGMKPKWLIGNESKFAL